jgi:hypothetical protein
LLLLRRPWRGRLGAVGAIVPAAAIVIALAGPAAYSLTTAATAKSGAIPSAGPAVAGGFGPGGGGGGGPRAFGGPGAGAGPGGPAGVRGSFPAFAGGGPQGAAGGLLNGSTPNAALTAALKQNSSHYTWVAAAVGSNEASGYQLATSKPVMAIGGFNGTDPAPTLAQFQRYVQQGKIHYFIAGGGGFGGGGGGPGGGSSSSTSSQITSWVESHFTAKTVGGVTLYDLTSPA